MTLEYLDIGIGLTITGITLAAAASMNVVKNNVANTIKAELEKAKTISMSNYDFVMNELTVFVRCGLFVRILFLMFLSQFIIWICTIFYKNIQSIEWTFFNCSENILLTLTIICGIVTFVGVWVVFNSQRQNILTSRWEIPQ